MPRSRLGRSAANPTCAAGPRAACPGGQSDVGTHSTAGGPRRPRAGAVGQSEDDVAGGSGGTTGGGGGGAVSETGGGGGATGTSETSGGGRVPGANGALGSAML